MIELIQKREDIAATQELFAKRLKGYKHKTISAVIGYPGGNYETDVYWLTELSYWCSFQTIPGSRYWNAFGLVEPKPRSNVSITCEINFPLHGLDRRIGAVFAKGRADTIVIAHRGKIGGGKKGVGKSLFLNSYRGDWETLAENGQETSVALVASLSSPRLGRQISTFLSEVERIKRSVDHRHPAVAVHHGLKAVFSEEFSGKKKYNVDPVVEAKCDHGLIVTALADAIASKGVVVGNDRNRDLYVLNANKDIQSLFEVKTDISSQSIYSAIGQLLFNSIGLKNRPSLVLVLPEKPNTDVFERLTSLELKVLVYNLDGGNVSIPSVDRFL